MAKDNITWPSKVSFWRSSKSDPPPLYQVRSGINYITLTVSFGLLVDLATYGIIVPVLPFRLVTLGYHQIPSKASFLVAAYAAGLIISSIPIGILGEKLKSRKVPLLLCLFFLGASLTLFWLSSSFPLLIISRVLQGFSGTGIWTLGLALICDTVPEERVGAIMGYVMIGWSIGSVIGPLAGGVLYDAYGYDSIFIFALSITAVDFLLRLFVIDKKIQPTPSDSDVTEVSILKSADPETYQAPEATEDAIQTAVPLIERPDSNMEMLGDKNPEKTTQLNISMPLISEPLIVYDKTERKTSKALLSLLRCPRSITLFTIIFVLGFCFGGLLDAGMTILTHHRYGLSPKGAGLVFIGAVVPSFASSPLAGYLADKYGAKWPVVGCLVLGTPFLSLLSLRNSLVNFVVWISLTGLFVMGIAAPIMEDLSQVVKITPGLGYAHVYSIFNMVYSIGALIGPLAIGSLLQHSGIERGWKVGCIVCTALCGACIIPAWLFIGEKKTPRSTPSNPLTKNQVV